MQQPKECDGTKTPADSNSPEAQLSNIIASTILQVFTWTTQQNIEGLACIHNLDEERAHHEKKTRKTNHLHGEPAQHVEVLPLAPTGVFEQTSEDREDDRKKR